MNDDKVAVVVNIGEYTVPEDQAFIVHIYRLSKIEGLYNETIDTLNSLFDDEEFYNSLTKGQKRILIKGQAIYKNYMYYYMKDLKKLKKVLMKKHDVKKNS